MSYYQPLKIPDMIFGPYPAQFRGIPNYDFVLSFIERETTLLWIYPYYTVALCTFSKWLSFTTHRYLLAFYIACITPEDLYNTPLRTSLKLCSSIHFIIPVASTLTSCPQHLRIYRGAILTSTRGLWTSVKCYFVQSSKWSDHKPSNRGINSQYWPVFLLRPAPMASSQVSADRPPAQTFAWTERAN